jgi:hypothetical protein
VTFTPVPFDEERDYFFFFAAFFLGAALLDFFIRNLPAARERSRAQKKTGG